MFQDRKLGSVPKIVKQLQVLNVQQHQKTMTKTTTVKYDLYGIDRIKGTPTVGDVTMCQKQLAIIQTSYKIQDDRSQK